MSHQWPWRKPGESMVWLMWGCPNLWIVPCWWVILVDPRSGLGTPQAYVHDLQSFFIPSTAGSLQRHRLSLVFPEAVEIVPSAAAGWRQRCVLFVSVPCMSIPVAWMRFEPVDVAISVYGHIDTGTPFVVCSTAAVFSWKWSLYSPLALGLKMTRKSNHLYLEENHERYLAKTTGLCYPQQRTTLTTGWYSQYQLLTAYIHDHSRVVDQQLTLTTTNPCRSS